MSGEIKTLSSLSIFPSWGDKPLRRCLLAGFFLLPGLAPADPGVQDLSKLVRQGEDWLQAQATGRYPDLTINTRVIAPDNRLRMPACAELHFTLPSGAQLWGNGSLGVRCETPNVWSLYTPYKISLSGPALVSRRTVAARQALAPGEVDSQWLEYQALPEVYLRDKQALAGTVLLVPVSPGTAIRHDMLRRPPLIKAGQRVSIRIGGPGFQVSQEGIAQQAGAIGETIRLKTANRRMLQGRVEADGSVSLSP
jgi:flagella basal body P-ring formation protein FlgA